MKMNHTLAQFAATVGFAIAAVGAHADTYHFELTGASTASFNLLSSPVVDIAGTAAFRLTDVQGTFQGTDTAAAYLHFFYADRDGGFDSLDQNFNYYNDVSGAQLFTGTTSSPTFRLGTFNLTSGEQAATLTITNVSAVSAVPEPSSIELAFAGLGVVGGIALRRRKTVDGVVPGL